MKKVIVAISERFWLHYAQCSGGSPRAEELGWSFWRMSMGILFTGQKTILLQGSPCLWSYRVAQKGQNKIKIKVIFFPIKSQTINIYQIIWKISVNQFWQVWTNFDKVCLVFDLKGPIFEWILAIGDFLLIKMGLRQFGQVLEWLTNSAMFVPI